MRRRHGNGIGAGGVNSSDPGLERGTVLSARIADLAFDGSQGARGRRPRPSAGATSHGLA